MEAFEKNLSRVMLSTTNSTGTARDWNQASAVTGRWLTAWATQSHHVEQVPLPSARRVDGNYAKSTLGVDEMPLIRFTLNQLTLFFNYGLTGSVW